MDKLQAAIDKIKSAGIGTTIYDLHEEISTLIAYAYINGDLVKKPTALQLQQIITGNLIIQQGKVPISSHCFFDYMEVAEAIIKELEGNHEKN
jgi:hypothetical protein